MQLPQQKKKEYFQMLQGNKEVALLRIVEDIYSEMHEKMAEAQRDSIFQDLEPAKAIAEKVAGDKIDDFKTTVDDQVNAILVSLKAFERDSNAKIDQRLQKHIEVAVSELNKIKHMSSQSMAKSQAIIAERINAVARDLESKIGPMGPEGLPGKDGKDGKDGSDGKDGRDGGPDTGDKIIDKIIKSDKQIPMNKIVGLDQLKVLKNRGSSGGGMGNVITEAFDGDGSTTSYSLQSRPASAGKGIMVFYQGQALEETTHFSISGKSLSLTFTPDNNTVIYVWYPRA